MEITVWRKQGYRSDEGSRYNENMRAIWVETWGHQELGREGDMGRLKSSEETAGKLG